MLLPFRYFHALRKLLIRSNLAAQPTRAKDEEDGVTVIDVDRMLAEGRTPDG